MHLIPDLIKGSWKSPLLTDVDHVLIKSTHDPVTTYA
jgi:hypothetical protein